MAYKKLEKFKITEYQKELFKKYISVKDIQEIAQSTNYSASTVYKIARGLQDHTIKTKQLVHALNVFVYHKVKTEKELAEDNINKILKILI